MVYYPNDIPSVSYYTNAKSSLQVLLYSFVKEDNQVIKIFRD